MKKLDVTKKAIEYYIKQGLLSLDVLNNGYRNFKEEDIERLRRIIVLRRLGLGTREIKQVLSKPEALKHKAIKNELRLAYENVRHTLLQRLSPAYREYMGKLEAAAKTMQMQLDSMNRS